MSTPLLHPGSGCLIKGLGQEKRLAQRMAQMGILPGSHLRMLRLAPMGDTVEVSVDGGQSVALRSTDLQALNCSITALPLSLADRHARQGYRVLELNGGRTFLQRMQKLGIRPGVELRIKSDTGWPLNIEMMPSKQGRALGHGEAEKIIVAPMVGQDA